VTIFLALWGTIGTLLGVLIGAWLTRSWQRKQWVLDSKKAEYRELISTLSESYHTIVRLLPVLGGISAMTPEEYTALSERWVAGMKVVEDRIFIDGEVRAANIRESWMQVADFDLQKLGAQWKDLHDALVRMAHQDLGIESRPANKQLPSDPKNKQLPGHEKAQ
jgi:hypothetical protein